MSASCNPPSHKISTPGTFSIRAHVADFCGNITEHELRAEVIAQASQSKQKLPKKEEITCVASAIDGISISEFLPDPYGEESEGEWIELKNCLSQSISLCGWAIDDAEDGSKQFDLSKYTIGPSGFLLLPRAVTKLALNNDKDEVRLLSPDGIGGHVVEQGVPYAKAIEGESLAWRDDGYFVWTPFATPALPNRFRTAERRFPAETLIAAAALPNPVGKDEAAEWIEIMNVGGEPMSLDSWSVDNKPGGSPPFKLDGIKLQPLQTVRLLSETTQINLVNGQDELRVLDPDGYVVSAFGWTEAVEGRIYRRPVLSTERASARVVNVVDGDTIDIELTDIDEFERLPDSLVRRWIAINDTKTPYLRIRLIGIDTPETVHPNKGVEAYGLEASARTKALLTGQVVKLGFDEEIWDKYDRLLAYVFTADGQLVQGQLLREGLAFAYLRFPFAQREQFIAYEREARLAKLGLWSDPFVTEYAEMRQAETEAERIIDEEGLSVFVDPPAGLVATGALVTRGTICTSGSFRRGEFWRFHSIHGILCDNDRRASRFLCGTRRRYRFGAFVCRAGGLYFAKRFILAGCRD